MTTTRPEIVIEGSDDGQDWREYVFRYKPGPVDARAAVEHPAPAAARLADVVRRAGRRPRAIPGSRACCCGCWKEARRCWRCSTRIRFPIGRRSYVRALLYEYRFTDRATHAATGQWWTRTLAGLYFPPVRLAARGPDAAPDTAAPPE